MSNEPLLARSKLTVVGSCDAQTERAVGAAAHDVGIVVVLAIVFPVAHIADFKTPSVQERFTAAAWTTERELHRWNIETIDVLVEQRHSPS